jgi:hypothetical protein
MKAQTMYFVRLAQQIALCLTQQLLLQQTLWNLLFCVEAPSQ